MSASESFKACLLNNTPTGSLPQLELMPYNQGTLSRWYNEGLPLSVKTTEDLHDYFELAPLTFSFFFPFVDEANCREKITSVQEFHQVQKTLFNLEVVKDRIEAYAIEREKTQAKNGVHWVPMHGFFWHPRELFGVTEHLMMFYENPHLMHEVNKNLLEFNIKVIQMIYEVGEPDIICISEDMAYNKGSMISPSMFDEFLEPYHKHLVEEIKHPNCLAGIDSDGDISDVSSWFASLGYDCISPFERQAGMDLLTLREKNPDLGFLGGYDKRKISQGEEAIYMEFESLKSLYDKGGFVPAVDHQTPPEVSLESYKIYLKAGKEFLA